MIGYFGNLALAAFLLALAAAVAITLLGMFVVKRHPAKYDPARNARRFTFPAAVLLGVLVTSCIALAVGLVGLFVTAIAAT